MSYEALGRVLVVQNVFNFTIIEPAVLLGIKVFKRKIKTNRIHSILVNVKFHLLIYDTGYQC